MFWPFPGISGSGVILYILYYFILTTGLLIRHYYVYFIFFVIRNVRGLSLKWLLGVKIFDPSTMLVPKKVRLAQLLFLLFLIFWIWILND